MALVSAFSMKLRRLFGQFPSTAKVEAQRRNLDGQYARFQRIVESPNYKRFQELTALQQDGTFEREREQCRLETFAGSREEGILADLGRLRKDPSVRAAIAGKGDTSIAEYQQYQELLHETETPEFKQRVAYLKNKNRFATTEMGRKESELRSLSQNSEFKWLSKQLKSEKFATFIRRERLIFDDFTTGQLDRSIWGTRFFWGDAYLNRPYSIASDPHCYTDGANVAVQNGSLVITTRPEQQESMAWDTRLGFIQKRFAYTSGLVCTGNSVRFEQGIVEAKIRFKSEPGVYHAIYLVGERMTPQIDLFRSDVDDFEIIDAVYTAREGAEQRESFGRLPFTQQFFIVSLEWKSDALIWRINGVEYMRTSSSLPKGPFYMVIASGVRPGYELHRESRLEVDWVRVLSQER